MITDDQIAWLRRRAKLSDEEGAIKAAVAEIESARAEEESRRSFYRDTCDPVELARLTNYIRMADHKRVVELSIRMVMSSLEPFLAERKPWIQMDMTNRRAELYSVLKVGARRLDALAEHLGAEAIKYRQCATPT